MGSGAAQVADDPIHLHEQRGIAEPFTFQLVVEIVAVLEGQARPAERSSHARRPLRPDLGEGLLERGVVRLAEHVPHQRAHRAGKGGEERAHRRHRRMRRAGEAGVIVEAARDDRDADGGPLEARHHLLVAAEHIDVASIAEVPLGSLASVADRLRSLGDQPPANGARRPPPLPGLVRGPGLLQPGTHRLEHAAEAGPQPVQRLSSVDQP